MESVVKDQLVQYLVFKGLISKHQHAFIKNHSMATNVLESINDWLVGLKAPSRTDVVYIDFSKAFDSIIVAKLIAKLMFLLYINDIGSVCCGNVKLQLYADDAKIYSSINIDGISVSLQQSLDNLSSWANDWQLAINISKCAVLSVSSRSTSSIHTYYINGIAVSHHNSYNDLGITLCQNLSFTEHISTLYQRRGSA
jgi:hypothetical protein